jgi:DNA-binding transcriptional ArsR family regulator
VPKATKFTRIPKVNDLINRGVPTEAIPTYCALSDYANNKTGLAWPKMETLAKTLGRSIRTIQRHIHLLKEKGLIEFVERRRHKGRFSSYLYRVVHIISTSTSTSPTTGHGRRAVRRGSIYKGTKPPKNPPHSPPKEGYEWLFKDPPDHQSEAQHKRARQEEREEGSNLRKDGYEWLFE